VKEHEMSISGIQADVETERRLRVPSAQQASLEDSLAELVRFADSSGLLRTRSSSSHAVSAHGQREENETSVSGIQARAPGQQASLEDSLAALVRLADSSGFLRTRSSSTSQAVSMPGQADPEPTLQPSIDVAPGEPTGIASLDIESWLASKISKAYLPGGWTLKILALELLAGVVLVAAAFGLRGGSPGQMKALPPVAAAEGATTAAQRSGETVAPLSDVGAIPLKDIRQPVAVKGVTPERQPVEFGDDASLGNAPPLANLGPTSTGAAQPTAGVSSGPPVAVVVKTPAVDRPYAAPPSAAPQFAGSKALRAVSLQSDGARLATSTPSAPDSSEPLNARARPLQPDKNAPKGANGVGGVVQSSSRKLDSPAQLSRRPSASSVVAKTETATPGPEAEKVPEALTEQQAPPEAPPAPAQQPANPLSHAFSYIVGALGAPAAVKGVNSEGQPVQLGDYASLGNAPPSENLAPTSVGAAQPTAGASSGPPAAADTSVGAAPFVAPAPVAPQFPDPKTKPSGRVVVAKIETTAAGPEGEKAPEAPPAPAQPPANPLSHVFSYIVGAQGPANQNAAPKSGDWAMQFAAEKSEAEAKIKVARLNARYATALNGATIGVQKTLVNGETIYALRVTGLSKADAAALCDRLKGRDCFIAR
jgi:hypothetical protein